MNITIHGCGYVGLVTAACLAEVGHNVLCVDIDKDKISQLNQSHVPIFEPGLAPIIKRNLQSGSIAFTTNSKHGVDHAKIQFITVDTPTIRDQGSDLTNVKKVAATIAQHMADQTIIINKSTAPVGTCDVLTQIIQDQLNTMQKTLDFSVVSNPEFLKEGDAVNDFMKPDRIIIGSNNPECNSVLSEIYAPFNRNHNRIIFMDTRSAELTKYASNLMLATKISFINEIANISELVGADVEQVRVGIGYDHRIGHDFIYPGCGFGGSCFPKDIEAMLHTADDNGYQAQLLQAVNDVNNRQKRRLADKVLQHFNNDVAGKTFSLWGLAFKPNTNDMRCATSHVIIETLLNAGARIQAHDPIAIPTAEQIYANQQNLRFCNDKYEVLENADALIICTEWQDYRAPDYKLMKQKLNNHVIFDGRNLYEPSVMASHEIMYYAIGRGHTTVTQSQPEIIEA